MVPTGAICPVLNLRTIGTVRYLPYRYLYSTVDLFVRLEEKYANGTLDMELALKAFRRLKEEFHQEFNEFELQVR